MDQNENFVNALKYAIAQGHVKIEQWAFQGWQDACDCAACRSQRIVYNFLFGGESGEDDVAPRNKGE